MAGFEQVRGGLGDADVALDADDDTGEWACDVEGVECVLDLWSTASQQLVVFG